MTFKSWVKQSEYMKENTPVGDLARDIVADKEFPNTVEKYVIREYLPLDDKLENSLNRLYFDFIRFISRDYSDE